MTTWGIHCALELHSPSYLLDLAAAADACGFDAASCSDSFHPWLPRHGHAGFAWSWLGAALERTLLPLGTISAPGQRQHPALVAQAIATLAQLHPGRLWVALGTGEAVHETITGTPWPPEPDRRRRLLACVDVIRKLLSGEQVTTEEAGLRVLRARLYTLPPQPVPILGAALTPEAAAWCGSWADGLVTGRGTRDEMTAVLSAYRRAGGRGPAIVQAPHAWAPTDPEACRLALTQWPVAGLTPEQLQELDSPEALEKACETVSSDTLGARVAASSDLSAHHAWLQEYEDLGFDAAHILPLAERPIDFLTALGRNVLPKLG
jgi:G6PDH family F420-dependent oxidoreductase